ncbi:MAG: metal ABC transporter permease [Planctomycetes bacterium]|nr:metal ABC transporter permease [Planctomycetota bacterium]
MRVSLTILTAWFSLESALAAPTRSITDSSIEWPSGDQLTRVITLRDYNTRVVVLGTLLLGLATGIIGTFMLLRRRALMGDVVSHATLPGIGLAFIVMTRGGGDGKFLPGLLLGGLLSGLLGMGLVLLIRHSTRLKEDAALGIVLSVFFGFGVALLGVIQKMNLGHAAGLESFIYGKTASMLASDAQRIAVVAAAVALACVFLFKEFEVLCFDPSFAASLGWPVVLLDAAMMGLVVAVTVIGLQAVGLILIIALLIIPPAAARFWTHHLSRMVIISAAIGAASGLVGAGLSALVPRLPAGAIIVVVASSLFFLSMLFGPARGVLVRLLAHYRLENKVGRQHLLRSLYETLEEAGQSPEAVAAPESRGVEISFPLLLAERSWSPRRLRKLLASAQRDGLVERTPDGACRMTGRGREEARRVVRNHRLWEMYLITHADIAPSHVDRDADLVEHVLGPEMTRKLEALVAARYPELRVPPSPHALQHMTGRAGLTSQDRMAVEGRRLKAEG